jgi:hypothetical protein
MRAAQAWRRPGAGRSSLHAAAVLSLFTAIAVAAQAPRVIDAQPGVSLVSRLTPDDRIVAVVGGLARPGIDVRNITLQSYVGLAVGGSSAAVVLEVSSASGRFTNNESWIVTDVSGTVKRVIYVRDDRIQVGEKFAFSYERGGELAVHSATIKAGVLLGVRAGRSYLVFLNRLEDQSWHPADVLFEITSAGRVVDPAKYVVPVDDEFFPELVMNNARFDLVLKMIREELARLVGPAERQ